MLLYIPSDLLGIDSLFSDSESRLFIHCSSFALFLQDSLHLVYSNIFVEAPLADSILVLLRADVVSVLQTTKGRCLPRLEAMMCSHKRSNLLERVILVQPSDFEPLLVPVLRCVLPDFVLLGSRRPHCFHTKEESI
jgi:hypothetical protein